ncbi:MAG: Peptidoglycan-binding domain 1 protein [Capsulimonas sp.]|nr:Peptidoglycan-binding domain 1 protein [Capsulimonas sp.]
MPARIPLRRHRSPSPNLSPESASHEETPTPSLAAPNSGHDFTQMSVLRPQAAMEVSQPGDPLELEAEQTADRVMRQTAENLPGSLSRTQGNGVSVQRDGSVLPPVPNFQLTPPSIGGPPPPAANAPAAYQVHPDPAIEAQAQAAMLKLEPGFLTGALGRVRLSPPAGPAAADPNPAANAPAAAPPTIAPPPQLPADVALNGPRPAAAGDVMDAAMVTPEMMQAMADLRAKGMLQWQRLQTGEKAAVISATAVVAAGALGGAMANPQSRAWLLDQLSGQMLPVPGVDWLHLQVNPTGPNIIFGVHADVGAILPKSWGFGPAASGPDALGAPPVQRAAETDSQISANAAPLVEDTLRSSGQPLDSATRAFMEPRFGHDFSQVRVHADVGAARSAGSVLARAYTVDNDIAFGAGEYQPGTADGQRLLAHELTHTIQQGAAPQVQRDPLADQIPKQVGINNAGVSFQIPGDVFLLNTFTAKISTQDGAAVALKIDQGGLDLSFTPPLIVDLPLVPNMAFSGLRYDFATASLSAINIESASGVPTPTGLVRSAITGKVTELLQGTRPATPGYSPLTDPDLKETQTAIAENVKKMSSGGGPAPLGTKDITNISANANLTFKEDIKEGTAEGGVFIPAGLKVTVAAALAGTGEDAQNSATKLKGDAGASLISSPHITGISIFSDSENNPIRLQANGKDIAGLMTTTVSPGGAVSLGNIVPFGALQEVADAETGVRGAVGVIETALGVNPINANANRLTGVARAAIEQALTKAVRAALEANRLAIPNLDLMEVFGGPQINDLPGPPSASATA